MPQGKIRFLRCLDSNGNDTVGVAGDDFPSDLYAFVFILYAGGSTLNIQRPSIVLRTFGEMTKVQKQSPQGFVMPLTNGMRKEGQTNQLLRLCVVPLSDQRPETWETLKCIMRNTILGPSIPNRVLIELQHLRIGSPIDHGAQTAIADWQRFLPVASRLLVPEFRHHGVEYPTKRPVILFNQLVLTLFVAVDLTR